MSEHPGLSWSELCRLRPVARVRDILRRRWRLGLGYVDARSRAVAPPHGHERQDPGCAGLCGAVQGSEAGLIACRATGSETLQRLAGTPDAGPTLITCHAGLCELALPVGVDDCYLGALLCGGFLPAGRAGAVDTVDRRTAPLGLDPTMYGAARARHPCLGPEDMELVGELLALAAEEIAGHARARGLAPRRAAASRPDARRRYADIIGASAPMQQLYDLLDRVVGSDSTVLVQGENGTGKELVARAIHYRSPRRDQRFVVTNCSAFNDNLLDSELFGHAKGAFTGAIADKQGLFEVADRGTFFLDEIGDMSPALQVKVLRVLQEGTFTRVGDTQMRKVDVRILAATNRDLAAMVARGSFREDLYYRINVIDLRIPPLRERRDDIPLLAEHFLAAHRRGDGPPRELSPGCLERLAAYGWPGNVRELENEVERLVIFAGSERLVHEDLLSPHIRAPAARRPELPRSGDSYSLPRAVRDLERRMIVESLQRNGWNKTRASAELEISRRNLIRLVQKYDLEAERDA